MKLLIDVGNSRIKWANLCGEELRNAGEMDHRRNAAASIAELLERCSAKPACVLAANVAGGVFADALAEAVEKRWGLPVEFARSQAVAGSVRNGYLDYRQLGVDRWLAILAAAKLYQKAVCVVDAGTAVTVDQVDDNGQHLGGIIVPGLALMRNALTGHTGELEKWVDFGEWPEPQDPVFFGRHTEEAMRGGALLAIRTLIEACMKTARDRWSAPVLVLTGGDAARIIPHIRFTVEHRPLLVLEGLGLYVAD